MRGDIGSGKAHLHTNIKHATGLLGALALGLMLACTPAYAAASSAPSPMSQNKAHQAKSTDNSLVSSDVGDDITDASIALLAIIAGLFFSINFLESRKNNRD